MTTEQDKCTKCGSPLPASVRGGLCPACLFKRGLETNTVGFTEDDQTRAHWTPPTVEQLTPIFPELDILELIGRGGMGAVYKAREKQLDRLVALKILPPEIGREEAFAQRFAREAQAMAKLSHSNIVTIYSFGQRAAGELAAGGDLYFFIMEYVDGLSLRQLLDAGTVSPKEALAIVPQICDALQYAHDRGIVHRDIKPENILLNRQGQVKIADFGLAKLVGLRPDPATPRGDDAGSRGAPDITRAGEKVMGTPQYMAPEQIERPRDVDHRADIYSLGVVFYQMLTGELPKVKFEPPSRKVLIDVRLDEVVLRALEREPSRRYQQVSEVRTQVETIVAAGAVDQPQRPVSPESSTSGGQYQPWPSANTTRHSPPWEHSNVPRKVVPSALPRFIPHLAMVALFAGFIWLAAWGRRFEESELYFFVDTLGFVAIELIALLLGVVAWRSRLGKLSAVASSILAVGAIAYALAIGLSEFSTRSSGTSELGSKGMVIPHSTTDSQSQSRHMIFGPVIERVVNYTGENCLIDLDTGTLVTLPKAVFEGGSQMTIEWVRKHGIDAGGGTQPEVQGLIGFDIIALPVDNKIWDLSGDAGLLADKQIAFSLSTPGNPVYLSAKGGMLATYKFRTREGGIGMLQIVGFTDDPKVTGIRYNKIRYKLLQSATAPFTSTISTPATQATSGSDLPPFPVPG